ncbi:hypothetical protein K2X30_06215 [bacterium]|jgi:hypothetical protein|nr:hypothetical protein [bacterium]
MKPYSRFVLFVGVIAISSIASVFADSVIDTPSANYQAVLGTGWATDSQKFKGGCIEGTQVSQGISQANLSFKQTISHDTLQKEFGFGAGGRARYGAVEASAAARFVSESKSDSFSIAAIYIGDYQFKNLIMTKPKLSEVGKLNQVNDERFIDGCGDEFVEQAKLGAKIFFTIRIDFTSESDKKAFEANFNISGPAWSASGEVKNAVNQFSQKTQVTVGAYQMGGDVSRLSEIFGNTDLFVKCSLGKFSECESVLSAALKYATKDFSSQLQAKGDDPAQQGGPVVLRYLTKPYATAGIHLKNPPLVRDEVKAARRTLESYMNSFYTQATQVSRYIGNSSRRWSERQRESLQEIDVKLKDARQRILDTAQLCWDIGGMKCITEVTSLNPNAAGGLYQVPAKSLVLENESFAQFCDEGLSPQSPEGLAASIRASLKVAKDEKSELFKPVVEGQVMDECFITETYFLRKDSLNLSKTGVRDLRPFMEFTQLESLMLDDNSITDLSPLASPVYGGFKKLTKLNLARNRIVDVSALAKCPALQSANLSGNRIVDPKPLGALTALSRLDLRNNSQDMKCPMKDPRICLTADYGNSGSFVLSERRTGVRRYGSSATALQSIHGNHEVLIVGGSFGRDSLAELYDFDSGSFSILPGPRESRVYHTATLLPDGKVLIVGGIGKDTALVYNPLTHSFTEVAKWMHSQRANHTATLLNDGRVLITGGTTTATLEIPTQSAEIFDPKSMTFQELSTGLSVPRSNHTATLMADGRVLLAGGHNGNRSVNTADIYDPKTGEISPIKSARMNVGRGAHQATLLPDGRVLFTGGFNGTESLASAEFYDPKSNRFVRSIADLNDKRGSHQASLLDNGLVILTGGQAKIEQDFSGASCESCLMTAELYDPTTEDFTYVNMTMETPRSDHSSVQVVPGSILLVGGIGKKAGLTAEIFSYGMK